MKTIPNFLKTLQSEELNTKMSDKLTIREIRDIIETEGLGEAIQNYLSAVEILDDNLAKKWRKCAQLLDEIEEYVNDEDILNGEAPENLNEFDEDEDDYE
jgi:hypothetical protein